MYKYSAKSFLYMHYLNQSSQEPYTVGALSSQRETTVFSLEFF